MKKSQRMKPFLLMMMLILNWGIAAKVTSKSTEVDKSGLKILNRGIDQNSKTKANLPQLEDIENFMGYEIQPLVCSCSPWADIRFSYRKSIVIHSSKIADNLTSFPVLIDLYDSDLKQVAQSNGNDIIFTDCLGKQLDHEIEKFERDFNSTHSHLVTWVNTNLSCVEDTPISLYYGNSSISNQENPEGVWSNDFIGIWHLSETSGVRYDSTRNNIDGSPQGFDNDEAVEGKIDGADEFDGLNDYIDTYKYPDEIGLKTKGSTISLWINTKSFNGGGIFEFGKPGTSKAYCSMGTLSKLNAWRVDWGGTQYSDFTFKSLNLWVYFVVTYSDTNDDDDTDGNKKIRIYVNGKEFIEKELNLNFLKDLSLKFGKWRNESFNGSIDEVRHSRIARSAAWIRTEFNNQDDPTSFYTIGSQEMDKIPPQINDFGVNHKGEGNLIFYANVTDELTSIQKVSIQINGSQHNMIQNTTGLWIYQYPWVNFGDYLEFKIANASDARGNWITTKEIKSIRLNKDIVPPNILQWEYYHGTNTFKANVTDTWGEIDRVILYIPSYGLVAEMVYCADIGGNVYTYMNDTLEIPNGPIKFQLFINDTNGNEYTSPLYSDIVLINHAPFIENVVINPSNTFSNASIELLYEYYDDDNHSEGGTEIRWYKNNGTGFFLQQRYNEQKKIPSSALTRNDQWYVTIKPRDGTIFGDLINSSKLIGIITILNTPPEIIVLKDKHPEFILEDQDLVLKKNFYRFSDSDWDNDQSLIWWYKDGELQFEYTNLTRVPAQDILAGEIWYYVIQAFDGYELGMKETSPQIVIESKPRINSYQITPLNDTEGHYFLEINTTDTRNDIQYVEYVITNKISNFQLTGTLSPKNGTGDVWILELFLPSNNIITTHDLEITVNIQVFTELLDYSQSIDVYSTIQFSFIMEDTAPPRVKNVFYMFNDEFDRANLTFYAQIEEYGSEIDEILLYYYFEEIDNHGSGGGGSFVSGGNKVWIQAKMHIYNQSIEYSIYSTTIPFSQNKTNWKVVYYISTSDKSGNFNENAFQIDPQQAERDIILYVPQEGLYYPSEMILNTILIITLVITVILIISIFYSKRAKGLELKAIDKNLVMEKIHEVSNLDLSSSLNLPTMGITLATFDEHMGPTPLLTTPKSLEKDLSFLYKIAFRSFSNCEFVLDLNVINQAFYNYTHSEKGIMKVLSYSFALDRPHYRGGQENITLSILIYPTFYTILSPFLDIIMKQIKTIHKLLNSNSEDKRLIMQKMIDLRELITKIILSYLRYY